MHSIHPKYRPSFAQTLRLTLLIMVFCVTAVSAAERDYEPSANAESCDSIGK